ncbi:MAG: IS1380 family transposase [Candidatus Nanopelagicales bacterium]
MTDTRRAVDGIRVEIGTSPADREVAVQAAGAFARVRGAAPGQVDRVCEVARLILRWTTERAYPDDGGVVLLDVAAGDNGILVTVVDDGRPAAEFGGSAAPDSLRPLVDLTRGLRQINLGAAGNELTAVVDLPGFRPTAPAPRLQPERVTAPDRRERLRDRLVVRDAVITDAEQIASLIYECYGHDYAHRGFYRPEWIAQRIAEERLLAVVAVFETENAGLGGSPTGEIIGHNALLLEDPEGAGEIGALAVAAAYRGLIKAPSTIGTFLRGFTFGHVRQLDAVASRTLIGLAQATPVLPGIGSGCVIDIDDTVKPVFGARKQGSQFGYTKVRGLNAQLATISTDQAAPVIAATRLRRGSRNSAAGGVRMIRDTIATARRCGASGPILVRSDSAYCSAAIIAAISKAGARFSTGIGMNPNVRRAIAAIDDAAWTRITYPQAIPDPDTEELVSAAEVAEISYAAFTSKPKAQQVSARLIVRRIPELNRAKLAGQDPLFPLYRYHAIFTDNPADLITAEAQHRGHAIIEQVIADLKNSALAHLPSGKFTANAAWLVAAAIAFNLELPPTSPRPLPAAPVSATCPLP